MAGGSASYLAVRAAVLAGIGLTAFGESSNPLTIAAAPAAVELPALTPIELVLEVANPIPPVTELADAILAAERAPIAEAGADGRGRNTARQNRLPPQEAI